MATTDLTLVEDMFKTVLYVLKNIVPLFQFKYERNKPYTLQTLQVI